MKRDVSLVRAILRKPEWGRRLIDWLGGALIAAAIGLPISQYYYARAAHDSEKEMRQLETVILDATRKGIVRPMYNHKGQIVSLKKPLPPSDVRLH